MASHIIAGEGNPQTTPQFLGQHYIDTQGAVLWEAAGVTSPSDWVKKGPLSVGDLTDVDMTVPPGDGEIMTWDDQEAKWKPAPAPTPPTVVGAVVEETTGSRTLSVDDATRYIVCSNAAGCNITVPPQSSVGWPEISEVRGRGTVGEVTFIPGSGVSVDVPDGKDLRVVPKTAWSLKREAQDVWALIAQLLDAPEPIWVDTAALMTALFDAATAYHALTGTASRDTLGATSEMNFSFKWRGAALGVDGKIYCVPEGRPHALVIDTTAGTASVTDFGLDMSSSDKWITCALAPNGKIYAIPSSHTQVLIIDTNNGSATLDDFGLTLGDAAWLSCVTGNDGKVYAIPYSGTDILIIDTEAGTATRSNMGASLSGDSKWVGAVVGKDGKIYGIPSDAADILIIDTVAGTATRSNMGASLSGFSKWSGGVLGPDGKIYGIPRDSTDILIIDTDAGTASRSTMTASLSGSGKWNGGAMGPDGKIYGVPWAATDILIIDPIAGTASRSAMSASLTGSNKWHGGVMGVDGKIYGVPYNSVNALVIDKESTVTEMPLNVCLSNHLNKF